jgi:L-alanine-DL-glutamate epimerase-like enolase superfamily enzyme
MIPLTALSARAYNVPTERPEGDGTLRWDSTTMVVVEVRAADEVGLGWTYGAAAAASVVEQMLRDEIVGYDALAVRARNQAMVARLRNVGPGGIGAQAISAVDIALWDLKAKLLGLPLVRLLDPVRGEVPLYGSGGFVTYDDDQLVRQLAGWVEQGLGAVKMKVGADPSRDGQRMALARAAIGEAQLMIDANGAFGAKEALAFAHSAAQYEVVWFEEPVPQDDLQGLRLLREHGPPGMQIASGEYGWQLLELRRLLEAGAVDVLQADATRCHGITGFLDAAALAHAFGVPLSSHTAPTLHVAAGCAAPTLQHLEWFHDHVRIEQMLFEGAPTPRAGALAPDEGRSGLGVELKRADAERFAL